MSAARRSPRGAAARRRTRAAPAGRLILAVALLPAAAGCADEGGVDAEGGLERETFVATYVDLRRTALELDTGALGEADRERVLARHGVSEDDLLRFAERHGADAGFMREVWDEVELRLQEALEPAGDSVLRISPDVDTAGAGAG